ncbi:hypothetical protein [Cryptosporangium sp. NPDC048952]|uniref:hypothetical protein n=1 Tax=Cryptosporangium sp. NPDC048952 TaxID=3363961 RepID=UPI00370FAFE2
MSLRTGVGSGWTKRVLVAAAVIGSVLAGSFAVGSPAQASSKWGCEYPRVCFYLTAQNFLDDKPTAAFRDVTSGYQNLGARSRGAFLVFNSRNDDGALLHFSNGRTYCLAPNASVFGQDIGTVDKIRISWSPSC